MPTGAVFAFPLEPIAQDYERPERAHDIVAYLPAM